MTMLRGYRGSLLVLMLAVILLGAALLSRQSDDTSPPANQTTPNSTPLPTLTLPPTLTPAPTIPFQQVDTVTLNEAVVGCVKKLNPLLAGYNQVDRDISSLIFEGLATTDERGLPIPDLAASWSWSEDGLVYVVKLRNDVKWHDGLPFTSNDVLFTILLMQDSAFPGPTDLRDFWQTVEVDALDEYTVRFRLGQPLAAFLDYLRIGIVPEHVLRGTPAANLSSHLFNLSPVGTGPYQFDAILGTSSQPTSVRLRLAAAYLERPEGKDGYALRQILFHCKPSFGDAVAAFQRGDVNAVSELPPDILQQVSGLAQLTIYTAWRPAFGAVIYNWQRDEVSFLRNLRMRQALAFSVDRVALVNKYMDKRALPADNPIVPLSWAYDPGISCPAYDPANPDAAKSRFEQARVAARPATAEANAGEFRFQLLVNNDPALASMAAEVVESWKKIGIQASVVVVDTPTFKERLVAGNFDAALIELNLAPNADPDPYSLWRQIPKDGGLNFGGMNERRLSELVESARKAVNGVYRAQLYHDFQKLFCDQATALLLYYPIYAYGADKRLTGIQLGFMGNPSDRFRTIQFWRFAEQ
jgi:peptide/nickel transport system substrate-binding protein